MENIAKLTSYGCYLDCDFVTAKYPEDETHIVGNVAEYVYDLEQKLSDLEAKLAESEKKLSQYPYKNDVIEKQYKELKDGIKFRVENNITDDWEQHYHCIDVLCEKHKARIRDIENGICKIEELEKLLNAKEKIKTQSLKGFEKLKQQLAEKEKLIEFYINSGKELCEEINKLNSQALNYCDEIDNANQDKISFALEQLEKVKELLYPELRFDYSLYLRVMHEIDNQIKQLKEMK